MLNKNLQSPSFLNSEEINGIKFKDVKNIVKNKADLENILFSTKIIFETREELIEFFEMLLNFGFEESAYNYFEEIISAYDDYELINGFNTLLR